MCIVLSPSLTTEKFNPHRYGIKKSGLQALRRETHRPYLFRKNLYFQPLEHEEHEKSYYNINFVNENRVYKKCVLYTER